MPLLALESLSVTIGTRAVLRELSFTVESGEIVGLIGASGSGKSMTALAVTRLLPAGAATRGRVLFEDRDLLAEPERSLEDVRGRGIGLVFQEPATALNPLLPIGAQVAETVLVHTDASRAEAAARADAALERVGLAATRVPRDRYPHELSGGQRQRVALALATALKPRLLVADEPTTALDVTTQAQILALLVELARRDGLGVVLISHDLAVVASAADRIAILRDGSIVEQGRTLAVLRAPAHPYSQALLRDFTPPPRVPRPAAAMTPALLEAQAVVREYRGPRSGFFARRSRWRAVDGVSLSVGRGERVGLVGESGSGKSTLVRTLLALEAPQAGVVLLGGEPLATGGGARVRRLRRLMQVVFQDPYGSLNPRHRVERIVAEPLYLLDTAPSASTRRARVAAVLADVGLGPADGDRLPHEFSGGQRQRIAIARALIVEPRLVVLDEAVSALDASLRSHILELLGRLSADRALAYLFVSHDLAAVRAVTDRTLVMHRGRIVEDGPTDEVLDAPRHPYTASLLAATPSLERALAVRDT
jgi:peptide/nickel transport system ATP-binding protein